jgi:molybdopterin molybdotransferase
MNEFFKVTSLEAVRAHVTQFRPIEVEDVALDDAVGRVLAQDVTAQEPLPEFSRSTMDGYALKATSSFGASEANPAYLDLKGTVLMGRPPEFSIGPGEACRISTGGMLPEGADSVVMIEHTERLDDTTIEVYRSVAPGQHVIEVGEDFQMNQRLLPSGLRLKPQDVGLLAAFGVVTIRVFRKPVIGIISTGDEVVPLENRPAPGQIRDINTYSLSGQILEAGGIPIRYGIISDDLQALTAAVHRALEQTDMVLLSGGSSVGVRDYTLEVLSNLPDAKVLVHGISISPGKPTILAETQGRAVWGLPGHVVSAMIVFKMVVMPFVEHIAGIAGPPKLGISTPARLNRNLSSAQGRTDFVRVRLIEDKQERWAEPVLGKSGLLNTMVKSDGLIQIDTNSEGIEKGTFVDVIPF